MNSLEDAFTTLLGRQPGDAEKQALFRARDAFQLKNNDALWLLLAMLGHYETLYSKIPTLIAEAAARVTEKARTAAEAEFTAAGARARSEMAQSVAKAAREIADRATNTKRSQWIAACLIVAAAAFIVVGGWAFGAGRRSGLDAGRLEGYSTARDERAAVAWANTPEGQLGYALAKAGSLRELATCSGKSFVQRGAGCYVRVGNASIFGWKVAP